VRRARPWSPLLLALTLVGALASGRADAAPGDLDGSFGTGGIFAGGEQTAFPGSKVMEFALDSLERPVVAFQIQGQNPATELRIGVLRLTTAGVLDPTFNPTGPTPGVLVTGFLHPVCTDGSDKGPVFRGMTLTSDDRIVIVADLCVPQAANFAAIMRLDAAGAYDEEFDGDGRLFFEGYQSIPMAVGVDASDRIYLGGIHCTGGGIGNCFSRNAIVRRLTTAGAADPTYNAGGPTPSIAELVMANVTTHLNALHVSSDGRVVAVGQHRNDASGTPNPEIFDAFISRFSSAGELETDFGPNGTRPGVVETSLGKGPAPGSAPQAELYAVTVTDDDAVVVAGQNTTTVATCPVAKFTAAGALDTSFASTAPTPGVTVLPSGLSCRQVLRQNDGKIVVIGTGPRPLGPGMSDTNQFVLARFEANGEIDAGFGVGGVVKTPIGDYAFPQAGALQSDGKILAGGLRRIPTNDLKPVVARYLIAEGPAATPTGGAQGPTPTPTATPIDLPGEDCDNGVDDEGDGYRDRADPECPARADGGNAGLGAPDAQKAFVKCAKAVQAAGAKLAAAKLKRLHKCVGGVFACVQLKPADAKCLPKAGATCAKQLGALAKDRATAGGAITKACAVPGLPFDDVRGQEGFGYGVELAICQDRGVPTLDSIADIAACVGARVECGADRLLAMEAPRAAELLVAGGRDPAADAPCLPSAEAPSGGLADAERAKIAAKCQHGVFKAGGKFVSAKTKVVNACVHAAVACIQLKPGDPGCLAKMRATCAKKVGALTGDGGIEAKLAAAVVKTCGALDAAELTAAAGLGFAARTAECAAFGAPSLQSAAAVGDCLRRQHERRVEQMLEAGMPRMHELLNLGQVTLP
jgi:uncharacterized delta-60 repeat protein